VATLSVGTLYSPAVTRWPETAQYQYRSGTHELLLFLESPDAREVDDVARGEARFGLLVHGTAIFFLYSFGGGPWSDAPFSIHLVPAAERKLPDVLRSDATRAVLQVILVDASTGIVRALRLVSLSPEFTLELHSAIVAQAAQPADPAAHDRAIEAAYRRFPDTKAMVAAARATCVGGAAR
jgi:hypothetical protein